MSVDYPRPVKRADLDRAIKTTGLNGLRWHAARNLCPVTREACRVELAARVASGVTA